MSGLEDHLRRVMRAADAEAPTADGFRFQAPARPGAARHRRWIAVAAAAGITATVGIVVALTRSSAPDHPAATPQPGTSAPVAILDCPAVFARPTPPTDTYPMPARRADALDLTDRLVPTEVPVHAVVCSYTGTGTATHVVDDGLTNIPDLLAGLPRETGIGPCTTELRVTDSDAYLIGLSYRGGTLWISAPGNHCLGASNGQFRTTSHVATLAIAATQAGTWAAPTTTTPCQATPGRLGQEQRLVPDTPTAVHICRDHSPRSIRTGTAADLRALVTALNALPTEPDSFAFSCGAKGAPTTSYTATFDYATGPPVSVTIVEPCTPAVFNGSLQAHDASTVIPILQQILGR